MDAATVRDIMAEATAAVRVHNMDEEYARDFLLFVGQTLADLAEGMGPAEPTTCACGDGAGVLGMCDDCFNVGCSAGMPCHWTGETHRAKEDK